MYSEVVHYLLFIIEHSSLIINHGQLTMNEHTSEKS